VERLKEEGLSTLKISVFYFSLNLYVSLNVMLNKTISGQTCRLFFRKKYIKWLHGFSMHIRLVFTEWHACCKITRIVPLSLSEILCYVKSEDD
jgi:hypothetical protein